MVNRVIVSLEAARKAFSMAPGLPGKARENAFPFISGDTYRSVAAVSFDQDFPGPKCDESFSAVPHPRTGSLIFVENILAQIDRSFFDHFLAWIGNSPRDSRYKILFANGDFPPPIEIRSELVAQGHSLFGQNLPDGEKGVTPIPIGIQNFSQNRHRALDDLRLFLELERRGETSDWKRETAIFSYLNVQSNPKTRKSVQQMLDARYPRAHQSRLTLREYRKRIMGSLFVPSPAGIGPDCFRTWEALYLGAVPVLLRNTIATSITDDLPIWIIDSWEELFDRSDRELYEKFEMFDRYPREKAFFPYWQGIIDQSYS